MASSVDPSTTAAKPLEAVAIIQSQVDALKEVYRGQFPVDSAVLKVLPQGTESAECQRYGQSGWSFTAKVMALQNGTTVPYFLKYVPGELGRQQLLGEFTGMTELWKLSPEFVVKPVAWGKLADTSQDWYFLLMEFKNLSTQLVDADKLARRVVELHKRSQARSDTGGKFGFPIQTFDGARLQAVGWDSSWASFFSKLLAEAYRQETEANGVWPELEKAHQQVQSDVIPRLLGVLEEDGRKVIPTLIHGDMWEGNVGTDSVTGEPWIFDCAVYYGHHEMELGIWRADRHQFSHDNLYINEYRDNFDDDDSYVDEEFEDRIMLYSAKTNFMYSTCFPRAQARVHILNNFNYLLNKYAADIEKRKRLTTPAKSQKTEVACDGIAQSTWTEAPYDSKIQGIRMSALVEARD
ncbi:Fructosamine/Ketosamine-3-kinase [Akanthomyces lecanii RCEF 1005]|uniref:protein-ribulosamine 3-kinase n=1 Tax=Akanthomyces lecanii RCEF 1005 TaxID=1081108 RepID=A0A168KX96_CORDF|nr:Fructosamine/Ketosamine-3-kinase [Akanthomyces lecanii RCEF 1005]